ncbi:MAG: hypothetical protein H7Z16_14085 [Pyrinomonadaceae bacterium]|nr:hypothetical protein [Pyrinomonadaceae bacterium]
MDAEGILSTRLIRWTELDQIGARPGILFSTSSESPEDERIPHDPNREKTPRNLRSVVERRFMRMNEAHDRIRTEMLCPNSTTPK